LQVSPVTRFFLQDKLKGRRKCKSKISKAGAQYCQQCAYKGELCSFALEGKAIDRGDRWDLQHVRNGGLEGSSNVQDVLQVGRLQWSLSLILGCLLSPLFQLSSSVFLSCPSQVQFSVSSVCKALRICFYQVVTVEVVLDCRLPRHLFLLLARHPARSRVIACCADSHIFETPSRDAP
jgi:hypothetical protein